MRDRAKRGSATKDLLSFPWRRVLCRPYGAPASVRHALPRASPWPFGCAQGSALHMLGLGILFRPLRGLARPGRS